MIGGISGIGASAGVYPYSGLYAARNQAAQRAQADQTAQGSQADQAAQRSQGARQAAGAWGARRGADPETPVQPVQSAAPVQGDRTNPVGLGLPIREGVDPVEMAVRMRIQYIGDGEEAAGVNSAGGEKEPLGVEGVQKAAEEGKCQTCEERKYQDGSDDMSVSYQTPTRIDPDQAASAVRGHEMEHVVHEQAKAQREDRKVVSQSVTLHTDICPECGKAYISGGTTRTTTAANPEQPDSAQQQTQRQNQIRQPFSAVA